MSKSQFYHIESDRENRVEAMDVDGVGCLVRTILRHVWTDDNGYTESKPVSTSMVWIPGVEVELVEDTENIHRLIPIEMDE